MNLNNWTEKIVFNSLKLINGGYLVIKNYDGEQYYFGNPEHHLKVAIKINNPSLTYQIIKNGSTGLAEAYMKNDFETDNLTNLIEIGRAHV